MKKQTILLLTILILGWFVGQTKAQGKRNDGSCNMIKDMSLALPDIEYLGKYKLANFNCYPPLYGLVQVIFKAADTTNKKTQLMVNLSDSKMDTRINAKVDLSTAKESAEKNMRRIKNLYERYKTEKHETPPIHEGISSIGFGQYAIVSATGTSTVQPDGTIVCMAAFECIIKDRYVLTIMAMYDPDVSVDIYAFDSFIKDYVVKIREAELN